MALRHYILFFLIAELFTLAAVMGEIGFFNTLLLWVACGAIGLWIVQSQGLHMIAKAQSVFKSGAVPVDNVFDGLCLIVAGLLFLMPGFLGDIIAILLLFPYIRSKITQSGWIKTQERTHYRNSSDDIIDGSYVRVEETVEQIGTIAADDTDNGTDTHTR